MSVIVGRALPDARDGLKPVQRRILFAMHELGLTPDRPYRNAPASSATCWANTTPMAIRRSTRPVRLVQTFASRNPLLDGHGNFGSVDDDPPAAMRYTERLAPIANEAMLDEIGSDTVDFANNFDGSQQPTVLPAQLPSLPTAAPASPSGWPPIFRPQPRGGGGCPDRPGAPAGAQRREAAGARSRPGLSHRR